MEKMEHSPIVAGIGGTFIYSTDPEKLATWYKEHLGIPFVEMQEYDARFYAFQFRELDNRDQVRSTTWSINRAKSRPDMKPDDRVFTINYRVYDMASLIEKLKAANIEVKGPEDYPEGKFAWIKDLDGNPIELWEDSGELHKPDEAK